MLGFGVGIYWKLTWSIIIPIALLLIFIYAMVLYEPLVTDDKEPYPPGVMGKLQIINQIINIISIITIRFYSCRLGHCVHSNLSTYRMGSLCSD